jgi:intracellular septation protein A
MEPLVFPIPALRSLARHAVPHVLEGRVVPLALFTTTMRLAGTTGALLAALLWCYAAVLRRALRGRRIPGILVIGALTLTARTAISLVTGSVFVYFLQPTLATFLVGAAFLVSVPLRRPLVERLAGDFVPLPDEVKAHAAVRRFFRQASILWGIVHVVNAAATLWFILSHAPQSYLVERSIASAAVTLSAIVASTLWFKLATRRSGLRAVARPCIAA